MKEQFVRTAMVLGEEGISLLMQSRVAVFGLGGVGGHAVEALARSGVGALDLIDNDMVSESNLNRQIIATLDTVGRPKTQVMRERIAKINPECRVRTYDCFYLPEEREKIPFAEYDYIVDAVDTVAAKLDLAVTAERMGIPVISSMGTGNKLDPGGLKLADIYETSVCPLARVMRRELKARGVRGLRVVYSREPARKPFETEVHNASAESAGEPKEPGRAGGYKRPVPGSTSFVPAVAGLMIAGEVIRVLSGVEAR